MAGKQRFATFFVGELFLGVDVGKVQEVLRPQTVTPVPLAPYSVPGLINLRGQILVAIDLHKRLGLAARTNHEAPMNVVVRTNLGVVSFQVDEIGDVLELTGESCEQPPETLTGGVRELTHLVVKLEDRLLLILDAEKAADVETSPEVPPAPKTAGQVGDAMAFVQ